MKFKAKIENEDKTIIGTSVIFDEDQQRYVIAEKIYWVDGTEWNSHDWEYIDINTLEIIK